MSDMNYNELSPNEQFVIEMKGTEPPFSGEYDNHYEEGNYRCRKCDSLLYESSSKFDAHCGWPAFDKEVEGSVVKYPDADGVRTEISCAKCDGHLGHVFEGEYFTQTNTRHCVNSLSIRFIKDI